MVDGMIAFIEQEPARPFFLMARTTQTHHPYEPTPGVPLIDMEREPFRPSTISAVYLNVLHETDRHLERIRDDSPRTGSTRTRSSSWSGITVRRSGTRTTPIFKPDRIQEDVHVPPDVLVPAPLPFGDAIEGHRRHVDLAPTIAALAGLPAAPTGRAAACSTPTIPRVRISTWAEDHFTLGSVRINGSTSSIFAKASRGCSISIAIPTSNRISRWRSRSAALACGKRLAAWTEANRRQYGQAPQGAPDLITGSA
jgi:hypothetical protein